MAVSPYHALLSSKSQHPNQLFAYIQRAHCHPTSPHYPQKIWRPSAVCPYNPPCSASKPVQCAFPSCIGSSCKCYVNKNGSRNSHPALHVTSVLVIIRAVCVLAHRFSQLALEGPLLELTMKQAASRLVLAHWRALLRRITMSCELASAKMSSETLALPHVLLT